MLRFIHNFLTKYNYLKRLFEMAKKTVSSQLNGDVMELTLRICEIKENIEKHANLINSALDQLREETWKAILVYEQILETKFRQNSDDAKRLQNYLNTISNEINKGSDHVGIYFRQLEIEIRLFEEAYENLKKKPLEVTINLSKRVPSVEDFGELRNVSLIEHSMNRIKNNNHMLMKFIVKKYQTDRYEIADLFQKGKKLVMLTKNSEFLIFEIGLNNMEILDKCTSTNEAIKCATLVDNSDIYFIDEKNNFIQKYAVGKSEFVKTTFGAIDAILMRNEPISCISYHKDHLYVGSDTNIFKIVKTTMKLVSNFNIKYTVKDMAFAIETVCVTVIEKNEQFCILYDTEQFILKRIIKNVSLIGVVHSHFYFYNLNESPKIIVYNEQGLKVGEVHAPDAFLLAFHNRNINKCWLFNSNGRLLMGNNTIKCLIGI